MKYRMVVNMKNTNALITHAMLASYINEKHIDYLGMLEPFVKKSLPEDINNPVDIKKIANKVNDEYGIDIKQKIVEKILIRLSKEKSGKIIRKESYNNEKKYFVDKNIDNSKFDKRKESMNKLVSDVVSRLMNFINNTYNLKKISYEDAQKYFMDFLTDYNYELYSSTDNLRKIQGTEKHNSNNYRVAKFILSEYQNTNGCYNKIKEIQEGYFASVAIYHFCNSDNPYNNLKLIDQTDIILDTRILIDVLGLNRNSEQDSMRELICLIKKNGGKLCTFNYYFNELNGIITKYLHDKAARLTLDLDYFRRNKIIDAEIKVYQTNLLDKIKEYDISIIDEPDYSKAINNNSWHIDALELKSTMHKLIDYDHGKEAFENDFNSLQAVSYINYINNKPYTKKNTAIFVTSNSGIVKTAKYMFKEKVYHNAIDIVISDIDLAAILWLSNYNSKNNLPDLVLLENAYAAICPDKNILNEVMHIIDNNIQNKDEEIRNNALLLRYDENILNDIAEITQNDKNFINDKIYEELSNRFKNRTRKELLSEEKEKISNDLLKEYDEKYKEKFDAIKSREENLIQKEIEEKLKDQENAILIKEMEKKYLSSEDEKKELKNKNEQLTNTNENIKKCELKKIENISTITSKIFLYPTSIIVSLFMFLLLYNCIEIGYHAIISDVKISNIINQLIIVAGTILTFFPVEVFFLKIIKKLSNKVYDYVYQKLYHNSHIIKLYEQDTH